MRKPDKHPTRRLVEEMSDDEFYDIWDFVYFKFPGVLIRQGVTGKWLADELNRTQPAYYKSIGVPAWSWDPINPYEVDCVVTDKGFFRYGPDSRFVAVVHGQEPKRNRKLVLDMAGWRHQHPKTPSIDEVLDSLGVPPDLIVGTMLTLVARGKPLFAGGSAVTIETARWNALPSKLKAKVAEDSRVSYKVSGDQVFFWPK